MLDKLEPCGGCGETDSTKACIGCLHWQPAAPQALARRDGGEGEEPYREGTVYVDVSGLTGTGKSAVMGEIEIAMRALGLTVEHGPDFQAEKNGTHANWQAALDLYKPTVVIRERNISRAHPAPASAPGEWDIRETVHTWIREDVGLNVKMTLFPDVVTKLVDRLSSLRQPDTAGESEAMAEAALWKAHDERVAAGLIPSAESCGKDCDCTADCERDGPFVPRTARFTGDEQ